MTKNRTTIYQSLSFMQATPLGGIHSISQSNTFVIEWDNNYTQ